MLEGMPPKCQVCSHPHVDRINEQLLLGAGRRTLARKYAIDRNVFDRHWRNHIPEQIRQAAAAASAEAGPPRLSVESIQGDVLLGQAAVILEAASELFLTLNEQLEAGETVDTRSVVAALREWRASLEALGKLTFALEDRPGRVVESTAPAIDAALMQALEARGFNVQREHYDTEQSRNETMPMPALLVTNPDHQTQPDAH